MTPEEDLWAELRDAWLAWRSPAEDLDAQFRLERAVDAWPEAARARPVAWILGRRAAGERPSFWIYGGSSERGWEAAFFGSDDDPRAALIDHLELNHCELEVADLVRRAGQLRALHVVEADIRPSMAALFSPEVSWSSLERLRIEACGNDADLRALARAHLPALHDFTLLDEEPLTKAAIELSGSSWWSQLRGLTLGDGPDDVLLALAAVETPRLEALELTTPAPRVLAAWRDPVRRPRLGDTAR